MTKDGEAFLVSVNSYNHKGFTIYDGEFNTVREFTDPAMGQPYQQRVVTLTRVCDPGYNGGSITRASASNEWTVVDDQTQDYTTSSTIKSFELYSDNNSYHSRYLYVSQTLFDNDDFPSRHFLHFFRLLFQGKCYVQAYGSDNSRVLYLLGNDATGIREVSRSNADFSIKRVGSSLVVDNDTDGQFTLVLSAMDGRIVRSLNANQGSNRVSVSGLMNGVYNVALYQQSKLVKSSKIIIRN